MLLPLTDERLDGPPLTETLRARLQCHTTLESIVRGRELLRDIVMLDEYSHDVVVQFSAELFAVYDST